MNLYKIEESINQILQLGESEEMSEVEVLQALGTLEQMTKDKVDNIASYIKNLNAEAKALKEEEENLNKRRKSKEKQVESLKGYIKDYLTLKDIKKLETTRNIVSLAKTPQKAVITDTEGFIEWAGINYKSLIKTEYKINLTQIKEVIKNGGEVPFVTLESGVRLNLK